LGPFLFTDSKIPTRAVQALPPEVRDGVLDEAGEVLGALLALPGARVDELQRVLDVVSGHKRPGS
jgi:hypothetical protein